MLRANNRQRLQQWPAAVMVLLLVAGPVRAGEAPSVIVQQLIDSVTGVLVDKNLTADQKRHRIEEIAYTRFNFETVSKLVLARNWKDLSPQQQKEFIEEFKKHLSVTYGKNIENYNDERAVVVGDRAEARDDWTVKSKIVRPNAADVLVDYRLRKDPDGEWRIIDVIIEGVSLVANFRSQFQEIISNSGAAKLIEVLREKNARGEPLKAEKS
ncbi:MAG TPA: ABC transporter substrate-binding protein [Candidatus Kryptonia bacterium]|nr:ABC transporter substrate-binding protein [Candidatus Kryptonia bacterium]